MATKSKSKDLVAVTKSQTPARKGSVSNGKADNGKADAEQIKYSLVYARATGAHDELTVVGFGKIAVEGEFARNAALQMGRLVSTGVQSITVFLLDPAGKERVLAVANCTRDTWDIVYGSGKSATRETIERSGARVQRKDKKTGVDRNAGKPIWEVRDQGTDTHDTLKAICYHIGAITKKARASGTKTRQTIAQRDATIAALRLYLSQEHHLSDAQIDAEIAKVMGTAPAPAPAAPAPTKPARKPRTPKAPAPVAA